MRPEKPERHVKRLLAYGRKGSDGRGNVNLYTGHACSHYVEIPLFEASEEQRLWMGAIVAAIRDEERPDLPDTPAMREVLRTFVGYGFDDDKLPWIAVCHHNRCYPKNWTDAQIRGVEVMVHGVLGKEGDDDFPIQTLTVAGPRAYCEKVCYRQTPHFYDIEVWTQEKDQPAFVGAFSGGEHPASPAGRKHQIVLRCECCHHGYNFVTKEGTPSRWRRLMKDETARNLLAGATPNHETY